MISLKIYNTLKFFMNDVGYRIIETEKIAIRKDIIMIGPRNVLNTVYYVWLHATIARTF